MNPLSFLQEAYIELKKVTWPTRAQTIQATVLVVVVSLAVGAYVGSLDLLFTSILNTLLK
ncbi:MAG: preprotein translocase subunit SecE [Candidatus Blackburnbacteria bacterium RIFCSPHIGHO2_12_FULL_44_25]|nr:MAG: preprotein translocase subunit SecE [Candidatus Blackburnbacteria bacterium RIFCSPHIGHO2_12_FULL_44_25]